MWTASPFFPTLPLTLTSTPRHHSPTTTIIMMSLNPSPPPPIPGGGGGGGGGGPLTTLTRLLWGRSLPPTPLISAVRSTWSATWHLMMGQLAPSSSSGSYSRPASPFPSSVSEAHSTSPENLVLYAAHPCPWAHRALLVRALKNLESPPVSLVVPDPDTGSWVFPGGRDWATGKRSLREVYGAASASSSGRATVPMLWDRARGEVACNESYGIIEFFNRLLGSSEEGGPELVPEGSEGEIGRWNGLIYPNVNNGVYRCGFAQSQEAYDVAVNDLFTTLDMLESHLSTSRYLCGDVLTLADVCLFTTLIRFDLVYNVLFKCTKKKLLEYPNLHGYTREIYQIPKVAETCNFEAIMDGYYRTLFPLNPGNIRPVMPSDCEHEHLSRPHNRESLSSIGKHPQLLAT